MRNIFKHLRMSAVILNATLMTSLVTSCDVIMNSRPGKLYKAGADAYHEGQETGDYTWFIIFIIIVIIGAIVYVKKQVDDGKW